MTSHVLYSFCDELNILVAWYHRKWKKIDIQRIKMKSQYYMFLYYALSQGEIKIGFIYVFSSHWYLVKIVG